MKLEIGCGETPSEGYTHLDIRKLPHIEIVDNATKLTKVEDDSCDEIKAIQVLEHFSHTKTLYILKLWYKKIKKGGFIWEEDKPVIAEPEHIKQESVPEKRTQLKEIQKTLW